MKALQVVSQLIHYSCISDVSLESKYFFSSLFLPFVVWQCDTLTLQVRPYEFVVKFILFVRKLLLATHFGSIFVLSYCPILLFFFSRVDGETHPEKLPIPCLHHRHLIAEFWPFKKQFCNETSLAVFWYQQYKRLMDFTIWEWIIFSWYFQKDSTNT